MELQVRGYKVNSDHVSHGSALQNGNTSQQSKAPLSKCATLNIGIEYHLHLKHLVDLCLDLQEERLPDDRELSTVLGCTM